MGKKYVPSGYQILEIESTDKDNDDILLKNTDDEKLLYELFKTMADALILCNVDISDAKW